LKTPASLLEETFQNTEKGEYRRKKGHLYWTASDERGNLSKVLCGEKVGERWTETVAVKDGRGTEQMEKGCA